VGRGHNPTTDSWVLKPDYGGAGVVPRRTAKTHNGQFRNYMVTK